MPSTKDEEMFNAIVKQMEQHNIPDTNSPVENIIGEIDPDVFKCHDCKKWLPISKKSSFISEPHCIECHPDPYAQMTNPMMRRMFPKQICKDIVSVQPMPDGAIGIHASKSTK